MVKSETDLITLGLSWITLLGNVVVVYNHLAITFGIKLFYYDNFWKILLIQGHNK